jgi:hypothetical protein
MVVALSHSADAQPIIITENLGEAQAHQLSGATAGFQEHCHSCAGASVGAGALQAQQQPLNVMAQLPASADFSIRTATNTQPQA